MLIQEHKKRVFAKLRSACSEVEDALKLATPAARYDPVIIPEAVRAELSGVVDNLKRILHNLEGSQ
jgi:hypothetical protein